MRRRCPACGERAFVPIVYGLPGPELAERERRGEIAFGGCVVEPGRPTRRCLSCGHERRPLIRLR